MQPRQHRPGLGSVTGLVQSLEAGTGHSGLPATLKVSAQSEASATASSPVPEMVPWETPAPSLRWGWAATGRALLGTSPSVRSASCSQLVLAPWQAGTAARGGNASRGKAAPSPSRAGQPRAEAAAALHAQRRASREPKAAQSSAETAVTSVDKEGRAFQLLRRPLGGARSQPFPTLLDSNPPFRLQPPTQRVSCQLPLVFCPEVQSSSPAAQPGADAAGQWALAPMKRS